MLALCAPLRIDCYISECLRLVLREMQYIVNFPHVLNDEYLMSILIVIVNFLDVGNENLWRTRERELKGSRIWCGWSQIEILVGYIIVAPHVQREFALRVAADKFGV